jgi:molybdate/tungstate transport system permease protein
MRYGVFGAPLRQLGIVVTDAYPGIVIAMHFMCLPYLVDTAREGFKEVNPRLENVARSLGASHWRTFREVTFPLAFPSILSGAILSRGRAISEFSAVLVLAYHPISAPMLIYEKFTSFGLRASRPISVLLITVCLVIFIILRLPRWRKR